VIRRLLLLLFLTACRSDALVITAAPLPTITPTLPTPTPEPVTVSVQGAVQRPGSYTLPPGSLVDDAVRLAGGPAAEADLARINLARELKDEDLVYVPRVGEILPTATPYGLSADGKIDINLADVALLETLPGIGPALAQRIVEYREMNGPFEMIEQLQEVEGIGPAILERIRDLITLVQFP
jgi:competence protein ComEA